MQRLILVLMVMGGWLCANAADRTAQWKEVDEAVNKGLPATAVTNLQPIIRAALVEKAYPEATKAIARRIALEGTIQGNKPEERITRLEAELAKAPKEMVPMLETILANWYWHYFQQNRWRFVRRTATAEAPGSDFTTWDLPRLFAEIDKHFTVALGANELRRIPINAWDNLLERGSMPDTYRPTLYDFVAHEALAFYTSAEQAGAKPQDAFEISADDPVLDTAEKFLAWRINLPPTGEQSPKLKAVLLYQELLRFHQNDKDSTALAAVDLERLVWANNVAFGDSKTARYRSTLEAYVAKWADHELSAQALYELARSYHTEGNSVKAHELATRGKNTYLNSLGGRQCVNLIAAIEAKSSNISTERVWNQPWPKITVRYRNVTNVWFRAVAWNWEDFLDRRRSRPENMSANERRALLEKTPTLAWSAPLPATTDYHERVQQFDVPKELKNSFYFLISSHNAAFGEKDNQVSFSDFWVSELALILRARNSQVEGFVLDANSGEPLADATIDAWHLDNNGNRVAHAPTKTDTNGLFTLTANERGYLVRARHHGQELASTQDFWAYNYRHETPAQSQTIFFTDRAIYRPGQTVSYKGISLRFDQGRDDYKLLKDHDVVVVFADVNGKEIAKQTHRCNDYGSFSGSFTAPRDRVMGAMSLMAQGDAPGSASVRVEEYKRPKFEVKLEAPKTAAKLNDRVSLTGKAESYTGAAVDGADLKWRVVREVRWPIWWGWFSWRQPHVGESQEIAHGTARTETDGSFKVGFLAKPDASISPTNEPIFVYSIHVDVTDSTGETRSDDRSIRVGYTALQASLTADEWQTDDKPVEVKLKTSTLDDEPQTAEGSLKIYRLKEPAAVVRASLGNDYYSDSGQLIHEPDVSDPNSWPLGDLVSEKGFTTDANGAFATTIQLDVGAYRATVETQDRFGKKVTALLPLKVLKPADEKFGIKIPYQVAAPKWSMEPGEVFTALWGSGYDTARAFIEIEHRNALTERYWTAPGRTQQQIKKAVTESMRGGFTVHVTQVRENRAYIESFPIAVPWSNKDLDISWEHFTSKLEPSQKETWTAVVKANKGKTNSELAVAEMVAGLYDASLDAFAPHSWMERLNIFYNDQSTLRSQFENSRRNLQHIFGSWNRISLSVDERYRSFPASIAANLWHYQYRGRYADRTMMKNAMVLSEAAPLAAAAAPGRADAAGFREEARGFAGGALDREQLMLKDASARDASPRPKLDQVSARKNLNETAFFFPQLLSDSNGIVRMQFTMPEALTKWQFLGFAHDQKMRSGFLRASTVTSKDLMVQPNPPRFVREGDELEFTVKVSNQSAARQGGTVRLEFSEAASTKSADKALGNTSTEKSFDIPAKESRSFSWRIHVPDGLGFLTFKAVASTGKLSDGEEGFLPVLSRRVFLTESIPLPIRGPATKKFEFAKLVKSGKSDTLQNQSLTVQMVSNPSWYAVLALPYLMEFPHECSEQTFNRFYANALARHIANSDPKIHRVFEQWRSTPALESPMEKNQDLKSVMIEETPWLRQANNESAARRNVGILFDDNRLNYESAKTLQQLSEMQLGDGAWPWFPGGRANDYITLYIVTGFGRMRHLGVDVSVDPALRALNRLDGWIDEHYRDILKNGRKSENNLSSTIALYLYGRSFFLKDKPVDARNSEAVKYFIGQAKTYWLELANRQSQGHLALALHRWGEKEAAQGIMRSIKERSVTDEELGRFWRDTELSWWWYRAPIETQALMIEAFDEVMGDTATVEECKAWLLKQKQTQDWKTTKATADAVYALMLRGGNWLASDALVEVKLGGVDVTPKSATAPQRGGNGNANQIEAGTGFYEKRFAASEVKPKLGEITVKKTDPGIAWGSVHWQYLEDISKVTPHAGTPLKLKKALFRKVNTNKGPVLEPVKGALGVGDELVVRIELRTDRDMEYVHMKDQRGSGTEPVNVLSHYKYQDGLAYYESTRDTASHFFIDYLPKGVYVFEYSVRVQHRGEYPSGVTEIQCMYAPEFNSHSESVKMVVK